MVENNTTSKTSSTPRKAKATNLGSDASRKHLDELRAVLKSAAVGDFSTDLVHTGEKDDFSELFAGVQLMQELIRDQQQQISELTRALENKGTRYSRALEEAQALTHLGSWEWDISTDVISWSDELYRIYGMKPQERMIGFEEFINLIHADDRNEVQSIIGEAFQTGEPFEFEHRITLPSGEERILKGMGKTIKGEDGKPIRMLGTSQDITIAKQLDHAKDEFISLVSHQLRTPLTIIRIHGNILEDGIAGPLDPKQETHIRTMTQASVRLIQLVGDILNISRVSLNKIRITAEPINPNKLIQTCVDEAKPFADSKQARVTFVPDTSIDTVPLDATIFGEVLRNLISNAVRYSKKNKGETTISFTKEKNGYLLSVRDNGIGIPKVDQAYIFERFYRANNANAIDSQGSGLGLYIVKLFVEASGGKIWFESTEGKGTVFYVLFPSAGMKMGQMIEEKV